MLGVAGAEGGEAIVVIVDLAEERIGVLGGGEGGEDESYKKKCETAHGF
jgi:hypothetical protein